MFGAGTGTGPAFSREFWVTLGLAATGAFAAAQPAVERGELRLLATTHFTAGQALGLALATALLLVLSVSYIVGSSFNPFIYFRF
jgi:hypothetical protein